MMQCLPLLFAEATTRRTFEWGRIQTNADWVLPVGVCLALMLFVHYMYRRDAVELPRPLGYFLAILRMAVILGLLILYLDPHWRLDRDITRNSRALVLVDTSLSMGLSASDNSAAASKDALASRIGQVSATFKETDLLDQLRKTHDVSIYQFNDDLLTDRSLTLPKRQSAPTSSEGSSEKPVDWPHFSNLAAWKLVWARL
jgi:hypothetical protein